MNRSLIITLGVLSLSLAGLLPSVYAADPRQHVELPPMMQEHMLGNMRDHLLAISEIQAALAAGKFDQAANIAEHRIGMSSLQVHGASHMAPFMPKPKPLAPRCIAPRAALPSPLRMRQPVMTLNPHWRN